MLLVPLRKGIVDTKEVDSQAINIYPNPSQNSFSINISSNLVGKVSDLKIIDITGKIIIKKDNIDLSNRNITINEPNLKSGVYFIVINANGKIYRNKIVISK